MRIKELAQTSGLTVATIKYYLREGLLPPGVPTAANQAEYDQTHLDRLLLIRALREGGDLSISVLRRVFEAMEGRRRRARPDFLSIAVAALSDVDDAPLDPVAGDLVDGLVDRLGWQVDAASPGRRDLVRAVAAVQQFLPGLVTRPDDLLAHASAMRALADVEIPESYDPAADPTAALRLAVLGTVLFEPVLLALRKLGHVDRLRTLQQARAVGG